MITVVCFSRRLRIGVTDFVTALKTKRYLLYVIIIIIKWRDRLCGLVVRVSGYRYRGPGFDPRRYQIF